MTSMVLIVDDEYAGRETLSLYWREKVIGLKWRRMVGRPFKRQKPFYRM